MTLNIQLILENERAVLLPLQEEDFDELYSIASDPKIWEQHPNKDRWKKEVFSKFFEGAILSKGAFKIIAKNNGEIAGTTRYYDYNETDDSIFIGYTFYATSYWGTGLNTAVKKTMLDYIFQFVSKVYLHVGACNTRSQIAVGRLGAIKIGEEDVCYFGEAPKVNFVYAITKEEWFGHQQA